MLYGPWPAGKRLEARYTAQRFTGSVVLGGVYSSTTLAFHADGRFEDSRFTEGSSGTMAPIASGFSAGAATASGAGGTRKSAGGGNADVAVATRGQRDDGGEHRGTYRLQGYTLELELDNGRVERRLCLPAGKGDLFLDGRTYSSRSP